MVNLHFMKYHLKILLPFLIVLLGLLAYLNSFNGVFVLDDMAWIVDNNNITSVNDYLDGSTRPLTALTVYLNYQLSGTTATDYHAFNLVIHLLAGLFLYGVVRRTMELPLFSNSSGKYSELIAFFSATLWVVHPLQTESVTYIIQRAESLMGLFYLMTLYCAIRGFSSTKKYGWFIAATVACALGMTSKPIMVTAPILVLLYDVIFISKSWRTALRKHWVVYLGLALTWGILAFLVLMPNESSSTTGLSLKAITPINYLATQQGVIMHYLKLIAWPETLCLDYAWPPVMIIHGFMFPAIFIMTLVITTIVLIWSKDPVGFCLAWFFIILAPSSTIMPIADYAVEHRVYLSLAGLTVLFTALVVMLLEKLLSKTRVNVTAASSLLLMFIVAIFMLRTIDRNNDYASALKIAKQTVAAAPYNFRARVILINSFMDRDMFVEAEAEARVSLELIEEVLSVRETRRHSMRAANPREYYSTINNQVGSALLCQDKNVEAISFFMRALELEQDLVIARYNLAVALHGVGRSDDALREVLLAIETDPTFTRSYTLAGILILKMGRSSEAIKYFEKAVELGGATVVAKMELAWLLAIASDDQVRDAQRAVTLALDVCAVSGGGNYRLLDVLAAAYAATGDFELAKKSANDALKLAEAAIEHNPKLFDNLNGKACSSPSNIRERLECYRASKMWHE